ncbi:MAG: hypothetical protein KDD48_06995 [Bdellovibrionales bacterium]|nr:hypothetical protein [Bdellovibrionales bacterium]
MDLITPSGIKITCPKCLTFILLKRSIKKAAAPIIERVAEQDGAYQVNTPMTESQPNLTYSQAPSQEETLAIDEQHRNPDLLSSESFDTLLRDKELHPPSTETPMSVSAHRKNLNDDPDTGKLNDTQGSLTSADLLSYPEASPPEGKLDGLLMPLSLIVIVAAGLLFLNYREIILIPGLEDLRAKPSQEEQPRSVESPPLQITPKAQYGFPVLEDATENDEKNEKATTNSNPPK